MRPRRRIAGGPPGRRRRDNSRRCGPRLDEATAREQRAAGSEQRLVRQLRRRRCDSLALRGSLRPRRRARRQCRTLAHSARRRRSACVRCRLAPATSPNNTNPTHPHRRAPMTDPLDSSLRPCERECGGSTTAPPRRAIAPRSPAPRAPARWPRSAGDRGDGTKRRLDVACWRHVGSSNRIDRSGAVQLHLADAVDLGQPA